MTSEQLTEDELVAIGLAGDELEAGAGGAVLLPRHGVVAVGWLLRA